MLSTRSQSHPRCRGRHQRYAGQDYRLLAGPRSVDEPGDSAWIDRGGIAATWPAEPCLPDGAGTVALNRGRLRLKRDHYEELRGHHDSDPNRLLSSLDDFLTERG